MKPEPMNIAVSVSKYYLPYTYAMLHSLLKNNACPIDVYVLHRELCPADFDFLRTLTHTHPLVINDCRLSEDQIPLSADDNAAPAAPESLFYLSIPRILPADLPRILYLDSDVIVNAPLSALYAADLTHHMLAACQTASGIADGVLLFNLEAIAAIRNPLGRLRHNRHRLHHTVDENQVGHDNQGHAQPGDQNHQQDHHQHLAVHHPQ